VRSEGDLKPRRPRSNRAPRSSGASSVAGLALDHLGALVGMDAGWMIRSATSGLERLVGRPSDEVLGHSLRSLLEPDSAEATITALAVAVQSKARTVVPGTLVGNRRVLLVPLPHPAPSAELYVVVTDALGGAIPPPGVDTEKQVALTRLSAGAAHEINNPLAAIVGNAELLLRRDPLAPDFTARVERILQSAYRVARVVRHLLLFVRAHPPDLAPTDVVALLREQVADSARDLELDGVRVIDELAPLPLVQADARQLGQAFAHIVDNALDATRALPPGQERIIRLTSRAVAGRLRLRIENSGAPIAGEDLSRVFDPFFTTKVVGQGAGLGLSVCQGVVSAHGGRIVAENLPHGVAVSIELPAGAAPGASDPRPPAP
jgi:signal transduction histidine kinase